MITKLSLIGTIVGLLALAPGFGQGNNETVEDSLKKRGTISEWQEQMPTSTGWQGARPGMTIEALTLAFSGKLSKVKKARFGDGTVGQEISLKKKIKVDEKDYKVSFYFDSAGHLLAISLLSNTKVKKETFAQVCSSFQNILGEPMDKEAGSSFDGSQDYETWKWKQNGYSISLLSGTLRQGIFVAGRLINVSVYYRE